VVCPLARRVATVPDPDKSAGAGQRRSAQAATPAELVLQTLEPVSR
jgi:hypothetical protein